MNKINKVRKGEVRIYKGMTYVAVPEIKEDHCTGCCFYNEGSCLIRDPDHVDFPDCHDSGMIWMQKEINISDIKEKAIKLAIDAMKPIPICSSPCKTDIMATKKQILESDELLQQKRRAYYLSDEGFEEYKKFLSDPDQKKFCFKGYYYVEVKEQDDKELSGLMGRVVYE